MNPEFFKSRRLRVIISVLIAAAALFIITGQVRRIRNSKEQVLTLGVFSDSYWGVQSGYANKIIDDAISRFEAEHPGVKVQYESGIMKTDYSEWLSEQMMKDAEPDVFFVPESDFSTFAQINALKNLNDLIKDDDSFNPEAIVTGGNNGLKPGQFDINVEDSELAIGYKQPEPATEPKPGRFQDPNSLGYY